MKILAAVFALLVTVSWNRCAANEFGVPRLTGIISIQGYKVAVLEWVDSNGRILAPHLMEGGVTDIYEVTRINEETGVVSLRNNSTKAILDVQIQPERPVKGRTVHLQNARLSNVLVAYQELSDCTVLRSENLTEAKFSLESPPNISREEAAQLLESALLRQGLLVKRQGKFAFVSRPEDMPVIASLGAPPVNEPGGSVIPPGMINFIEADLSQFLITYSDIADRTVIASAALGVHKFSVRSQTALSRSEVIWLMSSLLHLAGVVMVPESKSFFFAVAPSHTNALPHFDEAALTAKIKKPVPAAELKLANPSAKQVLSMYAGLTGRQVVPIIPENQQSWLALSSRSLSQAESIFLLEALAAMNSLSFQLIGDNQVTLVPSDTRGK